MSIKFFPQKLPIVFSAVLGRNLKDFKFIWWVVFFDIKTTKITYYFFTSFDYMGCGRQMFLKSFFVYENVTKSLKNGLLFDFI